MATASIDGLAAQLQVLQAKIDIAEHTARYNECWDEGRHADWVRTWTDDGEFELPGAPPTAGPAALRRMVEAMAGAGLIHLTTNPQIEVRGDRATQTCPVVLAVRDPGRAAGSSRWLTTGRYHDELVRTDDGWRFGRRRFAPDSALTDLPQWW